MRRVHPLTLCLCLAASAAAAVDAQPDSPPVAFAAAELRAALKAAGADAPILLGTHAWLKPQTAVTAPPAVPEAFAIARRGNAIAIAGHDAVGAMYGGLEVAEQIRLGGLAAVKPRTAEPFLELRQYKYNVPTVRDQEWFHSRHYWASLFGLLARARINSISFWHRHPFVDMIRCEKFPEAQALKPDQIERNIRTWRMILRLARDRGISTCLINWNIHLPPPFARKHGLEPDGQDAPVVRAYMRYCVAQTLRTYPDLTGVGACAGERMPSDDYDWRENWLKDTFVAGIQDSGRPNVPLIHRYWWASIDSIKRIILPAHHGPLLIPVKFNGEHLYTDTRPHFLDPDWIDFPDYRKHLGRKAKGEVKGVVSHLDWIPKAKPYPYKIIWHLRNDTIHTYRWGDPDFVREVVRNCRQPWAVGYLMGEERTQRGIDDELTDEARRHQTWKYHHERHWFRFMLWGRLGYDPTIPDSHWIALFERRYGKGVGKHLFDALSAASMIIPLVSRFHFNYMNGDWAPEWCAGSWNTGFGRGRNYRDGRDDFHDILEFIFNHTISSAIVDATQYAARHRSYVRLICGDREIDLVCDPPRTAEELHAASEWIDKALEDLKPIGLHGEAETLRQECQALAELGRYYAHKIDAAWMLMEFLGGNMLSREDLRRLRKLHPDSFRPLHGARFLTREDMRKEAVAHLLRALEAWMRLDRKASALYRRASQGSRSYGRLLSRVRRDVLIAGTAQSAREELRKLGVVRWTKDRPHYDFSNPELRTLIDTKLAPASVPIFFLDKVELSPKTCDVLVLGREAWAFHDLPAARKKLVLDAVARGVGLVILFQNFPRFDPSWLPGKIGGADRDSNSFAWTDPKHPIAKGVDPKALEGGAILNDALTGYDESWANLTDPPGGLCIRTHGKGVILFCQLDIPSRHRIAAARQLIRNLIGTAAPGKRKPRIVLLDTSSTSTARILEKAGRRFLWIDDLPLAQSAAK